MEYQQALDYIYSFVDYETKRMPRDEAHFDLRRMEELMQRLGNPHLKIPSVHIAGTNGKGSTAAMIASVMTASGYATGLNTSPHLTDIRERFMIDGNMISEGEIITLTEKLKPEVEAINRKAAHGQLTTFEIMTAMAFDYFKQKGCRFQVIEVGMGGRLDATNIIMPEVSVITAISYDHTEVLGKTLTDIARQKAGIIKPNSIVVSHPQPEEALKVLAGTCIRLRTKLLQVGVDVCGERLGFDLDGQRLRIRGRRGSYDLFIPLLGHYQLDNAAAAVAVLEVLAEKGFKVTHDTIVQGMAQVKWPGRFHILNREPLVVADGGHNPGAVNQLKQSLEAYFGLSHRGAVDATSSIRNIEHSILVIGASFDKDIAPEVKELSPLFDRVIVTRANHPRAAATAAVAAEFVKNGKKPLLTESVPAALSQALKIADKYDLICVGGSLFVVGEAIDYFDKVKKNKAVEEAHNG